MDRWCGRGTVREVLGARESEGASWAAEQVAVLRRMSPTSLCVSLELIRRGAARTLEECLEMELALTRVMVNRHPDFREGVRSAVVDKDGRPNWSPARLEEVDPAAIQAMFA